jgi:hypothetical protein
MKSFLRNRILVNVWGLTAVSFLTGCGAVGQPPAETSADLPVPQAGIAYAKALNNQDAAGVAEYLWFPGPSYPDHDTVPPDRIPEECVEGELDLFVDREIDVGEIRAERRVFGVTPIDGPGVLLIGEYDMLWLPTGEGQEDGRQFTDFDGRVVISPQENEDCTAAARAIYGEE